jgi:hypothetical protein
MTSMTSHASDVNVESCWWFHLHMIFFKKINLLIILLNFHSSFVTVESTVRIFLHFSPSKIHVSLTGVVSSLSTPRYHLSSSRRRHTATSWRAYFPWSQDEHIDSPLKLKLEHWIHNTTVGHPPWIFRLSPSVAIKRSSWPLSLSPPLNCVSISSPL